VPPLHGIYGSAAMLLSSTIMMSPCKSPSTIASMMSAFAKIVALNLSLLLLL
jgi:hypothetical protein